MELILNELTNIQDKSSVRGVVILEKDGNIIFKKDNIITFEGRKWLSTKLLSNNSSSGEIDKIGFGSGTRLPEANDTALANHNPSLDVKIKNTSNATATEPKQTTVNNINSVYVEYAFTGLGTGLDVTHRVNELGLFIKQGNDDILFSRLVFDPVVIGKDNIYNIKYRIYF